MSLVRELCEYEIRYGERELEDGWILRHDILAKGVQVSVDQRYDLSDLPKKIMQARKISAKALQAEMKKRGWSKKDLEELPMPPWYKPPF